MGPAPMKEVERTNAVVVREQGARQSIGVPSRLDPYTMEVDRGRNCYACGGFGHMAHHCKNRGGRVAKGEGWNMEEEESREILNIQTI